MSSMEPPIAQSSFAPLVPFRGRLIASPLSAFLRRFGSALVLSSLAIVFSAEVSGLPAAQPAAEDSWLRFEPTADPVTNSAIDLRFLNERFAGEHGFIAAQGGHFVYSGNGQPVRFWAVNGPPQEDGDRAALRPTARLLAKYGVNLVRRHGAVFDHDGELVPAAVKRAIAIVEAMKTEGIYTHLSIYFPLWFS